MMNWSNWSFIVFGLLIASVILVRGTRELLASCSFAEPRQYDCFLLVAQGLPAVYKKTTCIAVYDNSADGDTIEDVTPKEKNWSATADSGNENTDCNPVKHPTIATFTFDGDFVEMSTYRKKCTWNAGQ